MTFGDLLWSRNPWYDVDRMVGRPVARPRLAQAAEYPAINVFGSSDDVVVTAELPGMDPKALDITVEDKVLTMRGRRQADELAKGERYHRQERGQGAFARAVSLPHRVASDKVSASYKSGVLTITLPMAEEDKPRKIEVKS